MSPGISCCASGTSVRLNSQKLSSLRRTARYHLWFVHRHPCTHCHLCVSAQSCDSVPLVSPTHVLPLELIFPPLCDPVTSVTFVLVVLSRSRYQRHIQTEGSQAHPRTNSPRSKERSWNCPAQCSTSVFSSSRLAFKS